MECYSINGIGSKYARQLVVMILYWLNWDNRQLNIIVTFAYDLTIKNSIINFSACDQRCSNNCKMY